MSRKNKISLLIILLFMAINVAFTNDAQAQTSLEQIKAQIAKKAQEDAAQALKEQRALLPATPPNPTPSSPQKPAQAPAAAHDQKSPPPQPKEEAYDLFEKNT